jgi:hypothetical protein
MGRNAAALYAGGAFQFSGSLAVNHIAKWNGTAWSALGSGTGPTSTSTSEVYSLRVFDADGSGPGLPVLVVGGGFTLAGGIAANRIATWNGASWAAMGSGVSNVGTSSTPYVYSLTEFDEDGNGPAFPTLYAGGSFNSATARPRTVSPNGTAVHGPLSEAIFRHRRTAGYMDSRYCSARWGLGPQLIILGGFQTTGSVVTSGIVAWNRATWSDVGGGIYYKGRAACSFDDDGDASTPPILFVGGQLWRAGSSAVDNIATWNGASWSRLGPFGAGANGAFSLYAMESMEDFGPQGAWQTMLFVSGDFTSFDGVSANEIAKWDGRDWFPLGSGLGSGAVWGMLAFDEDGPGPTPRSLYAVGSFSSAGGVATKGIARWDGEQWFAVGGGVDGPSPYALAAAIFDEDGDGPVQPALYIAGDFTIAGGVTVNRVARWDGQTWSPVGNGIGMNYWVRTLAVWDDDGPGPHLSNLYAGGAFTTADGIVVNGIAKWDGNNWSALGSGLATNPAVDELVVFDDDGPGPHATALYAGGVFSSAGGVSAKNIAKWDGSAWSPLAAGLGARVWGLKVYDSDGMGPNNPGLYAGGEFNNFAGQSAIARWDGVSWTALGSGLIGGSPNYVEPMAEFDDDGPGPNPSSLYVGGSFKYIPGGATTEHIARWGKPVPFFRSHPKDVLIEPGIDIAIAADAGGATPDVSMRKDDNACGRDRISGATTSTLAIASAKFDDSGGYDLVITNACGTTTSRTAALVVACPNPPIDGDFNNDGKTDGQDIQEFTTALLTNSELANQVCAGDFDLDGIVGESDIVPFIERLLNLLTVLHGE